MTKDDVLQAVIAGAKANGSWDARYGEVSIKEGLAPTSTQCEVQPNLDQGPDYERGFVDGMLYQTQTSVGKAVNAMAQPEQKPVAWGVFEGNLHDMFFIKAEAVEMAHLKGSHAEVRPLYTTPQKRPWVGLTDEEISQLWISTSPYFNEDDFAKAVGAKLKEKNT